VWQSVTGPSLLPSPQFDIGRGKQSWRDLQSIGKITPPDENEADVAEWLVPIARPE
jgi:hypothetical protein